MSSSVNLVPIVWLNARAAARRERRWLAACATAVLLLVVGWGVLRGADRSLDRLAAHVGALEDQREGVESRLHGAATRRDDLLEGLHTLADARRPQPWPHRLAALARAAPPGVFLTAIHVTEPSAARQPAAPVAEHTSPTAQLVRLHGYAMDHASLTRFLDILQATPGWQNAELVRATLEPFRGAHAVSFEFSCRAPGDSA